MLDDKTDFYKDTALYARLKGAGFMHIVAVSGLHLSLLGMGLFTVLRRLCLPLLPSGLIVTVLMLAYTVFVGSPVSAVRACAMFILMIAAQLTGRTYDPLTALAAAALLVLMANPEYLFYSGFQLSVSAVVLCSIFSSRSGFMLGVFLCKGDRYQLLGN